ncbi:MAG: EAL domain-containing protein [Hahellaceae bacterium]|nr:EAL domain-containing protein [Hahellaceae bacterium]
MNNIEESINYLLRLKNSRPAWFLLIFALLTTLSLWHFSVVLVKDRTKASFENESQQLKTAIEERLLNYEQVLAGSAGLFAVADLVGRDDWRTYVNKLDIERYYPGIQGLGFTQKVDESDVAAHIARIRAQGLPNYLVSPQGHRSEYHPVVFLEPSTQRNRRAYGYDAFGDPSHRMAMEIARDTGQAAMTGKVVLVQEEVDETQPGFVMYYPVYKNDQVLKTTLDRRASLLGFVFSAFRMNNLMDGIVGLISPFLDVRIYDSDVAVEESLMYASNLGSLDEEYSFEMSQTLSHGGKTWLLITRTTPAFDFLASDPRPWIVLVAGILISLLLFVMALLMIRSRLIAMANAGKYRAITEDTTNMTMVIKPGFGVTYTSPSCERIMGYQLTDLRGKSFEQMIHSDDLPALIQTYEKAVLQPGKSLLLAQTRVRHKDGSWLSVEGGFTSMCDVPGVNNVVVNFRDTSRLSLVQSELHQLAFYDQLTGLANRQLFRDRLDHTVKTCRRRGLQAALMYLDLDGFKRVNDTLGHDAGDRLLQQVAQWLEGCVREEDSVARLGGDEFTVLLEEVSGQDSVSRVAENILTALSQRVRLGEHEVGVSASIGIVMIPGDGEEVTSLMKFADLAMYRAKELGRNNYQYFQSSLNIRAARRLLLQEELRTAVELHQFVLHYQPKIDLESQKLVGIEALVRWNHPDRGLVTPDQFLPLAEDTGLIHQVGEWVLRQACIHALVLAKTGFEGCRVGINLSARQVGEPHFVDRFLRILEETGCSATMLELDVSSSILTQDLTLVSEIFGELKALGVTISLDDFGTGFCSLEMLGIVPVDEVKIDRTFIRDIPYKQSSAEVTSALIALAHKLGLKVVAEGVETREQLSFLEANNCEYAQGNLFSQALDEDQLAIFMTNLDEVQKHRFIYYGNEESV